MADRMLYLACVVSIAGILLIAFVSPSIRPPLSQLRDVTGSSLEKAVRVEGTVSRLHTFTGGSVMMTLSDDDASMDVYLPYDVAASLGEDELVNRTVEVLGVVQLYNGRLELVVEKPGNVVVK